MFDSSIAQLANPISSMEELEMKKIPRHIAIIMDGNRRWAKENFLAYNKGHTQGVQSLLAIVKTAAKIGVEIVTVYAFSTENWNRPKLEVYTLMELFKHYLIHLREEMVQNGVRLNVIGDISRFSPSIIQEINETIHYTKNGAKINLILALNYGGRDEIKRAFLRLLGDYKKGCFVESEVTEEMIAKYLDTAAFPDPDLLIRTSGENRISNFLLWQSSYTEMYTTEKYWPDFGEEDLIEAVSDYQKRQRRRGK